MDVGRLQPAEHVAAARAAHHLGLPAGRHGRHRRRRTRPGSPGHQGAAGRGAARVDTRCGEAVASVVPSSVCRAHRCRRRRRCSQRCTAALTMKLFGLGLVAALVGVMVSLPLAVRPLAALIATPLGCAACPASWRSRTRCATRVVPSSTAAALMIGLTLVVSMGVFASSLKASFGDVISRPDERRPVRRRRSSAQGPGFSPSVHRCGQGRDGCRAGLGQRLGPGSLRRRGHQPTRRSTRPPPRR